MLFSWGDGAMHFGYTLTTRSHTIELFDNVFDEIYELECALEGE